MLLRQQKCLKRIDGVPKAAHIEVKAVNRWQKLQMILVGREVVNLAY